ncbi:MAG: hypothetical protein R3B06_18030 [Kofleriaceae bacterium]
MRWLHDPDDRPRLKVWHVLFLVAPVLVWLAWSSYRDFTHLETYGGTLRVGRTTKLLYQLGGKWAVVGAPLVGLAVWLYGVVVTLRLHRRADELAGVRAPPTTPPPDLPVAVVKGALPAPTPLAPLAGAAPRPAEPVTASGDGPRLLR